MKFYRNKANSRKRQAQIQENTKVINKLRAKSSPNKVPQINVPSPSEKRLPREGMNSLSEIPQKTIKNEDNQLKVDPSKNRFTIGELLSLDSDKIPFLVEALIPEQAITILAGQSDVGKSLLYLQLALSIIQRKNEFLGFKINSKYNKVLLVSSEDGAIQISNRIKKQLGGCQSTDDFCDSMVILTASDNIAKKVEVELKTCKYDLVILDALGDILDGDSNSLGDARRFLNQFSELIHKYGCSFLIVHHIGKGREKQGANKSQLLGSVGIEGKARQVLMLVKSGIHPDARIIIPVKANYLSEEEKRKTINIQFNPNTLIYSPLGHVDTCNTLPSKLNKKKNNNHQPDMTYINNVVSLREIDGKSFEEIGKMLGKHKSTICRTYHKYKPKPIIWDPSLVDVP